MSRIISVVLLSAALQSCSSYSSAFSCPDAKGLNCMPMRVVDIKIDNGEVEDLEQICRGKKCRTERMKQLPALKYDEANKINIDINNEFNEDRL